MLSLNVNDDIDRISSLPDYVDSSGCKPLPMLGASVNLLSTLQRKALVRAIDAPKGCLINLPMGSGKTLLAFLIMALTPGVEKPLYVVPPASIKDTKLELKKWKRHFPMIGDFALVSSGKLSTKKGKNFYDEYAPDLVVVDEVQIYQDPGTLRTFKLLRHAISRGIRFYGLSATVVSTDISKYAHLCELVAGDLSPLPTNPDLLASMTSALKNPHRDLDDNAIMFMDRIVRKVPSRQPIDWLRRVVKCNEAIVNYSEPSCPLPLSFYRLLGTPSVSMVEACKVLENDWQLPDGTEIVDALEYLLQQQYMSMGFFREKRFSSEDERTRYRTAVSAWNKVIRTHMTYRRTDVLDAPSVVTSLAKKGRLSSADQKAYENFCKVQSIEHSDIYHYVDENFLYDIVSKKIQALDNCLIWFTHAHVAAFMSRRLGISSYSKGDTIVSPGERFVLLSTTSFYAGKNMQAWNNNILLEPIVSGARLRQLFARTHRQGQEKPVSAWLNTSTPFLARRFETGMRNMETLMYVTGAIDSIPAERREKNNARLRS